MSRARNPHVRRSRARRRALQALYQWTITGQESADILRQFGEEQDMSSVDVEYFEALVRDTIASAPELTSALGEYLDRDWQQIDLMERSVLLIGAFELRARQEIPFRVAIKESVDLAGAFGTDQSPDYVNAVLDRCAREWRADEYRAASS
ncbi:MAG: transcription antitermination factor NusB [Xanthomonadales bacterium]|nr:transcription antitermination factor NusB [Xanthomonadales bacterium]